VDSVAIAPVQQKTKLPLHGSNGASACFSVLSFVMVWVVRLARVCCNSWCNSWPVDGFVNSKPGSFRAFRLVVILMSKLNLPKLYTACVPSLLPAFI
jgi:hypothetical protein